MVFMPGPFEILLLLVVGGAILFALTRVIAGGSSASKEDGFTLGHTTLKCPHCGRETRAGLPTCQACGQEL